MQNLDLEKWAEISDQINLIGDKISACQARGNLMCLINDYVRGDGDYFLNDECNVYCTDCGGETRRVTFTDDAYGHKKKHTEYTCKNDECGVHWVELEI
jgi:hypothetical protein